MGPGPLVIAFCVLVAVGSAAMSLAAARRIKRLTTLEPSAGPDGERFRISVVVPARDEAETIEPALRTILAQRGVDIEVIVVDDGSTDDTGAIGSRWASRGDHTLLLRQVNLGKGAAIRAAIPHVTGDVAVIQDADMEYDPRDLPKVLAPLLDGVADVVYGTRLRGGEPQRAHLFWHLVGNRFLSLLTNVLFNTTLSDMSIMAEGSPTR